jgi:hypothetical protein
MQNRTLPLALAGACLVALVSAAPAHAVYVYPNKGQSKKQLERDKFACFQWAREQTRFDPQRSPRAYGSGGGGRSGPGALGGAARGAAGGAIGGAIAGNAGRGAAIGALIGGVFGAARRQRYHREQAAARRGAEARYLAHRNQYYKAYAVCLNARGYSVRY